eukprot:1431697-Amphidinium_carterae.1
MADAEVFLKKAQRQATVARKAQHIGEEKTVKKLMTLHPGIVKPLLSYAQQLVDAGAGMGPISLPVACVPQGQGAEEKVAVAKTSTQCPLAMTEDEVKAALNKPIYRQYPNLNRLPVADLKNILRFMEPIVFSGFALQGLAPRGKRAVNKDTLAQLVSYVTGVPYDQGLEGTYTSLLAAAEHMSKLNVANGQLGHSLVFPLVWEEHGHYSVVELEEPGMVMVQSRRHGPSHSFSLSPMGFPLVRKLIIQKNWDETHAVLKCQENVDAMLTLCMVFKGNGVRKRPLGALHDGSSKRSRTTSCSGSPVSAAKQLSGSQGSAGDNDSLLDAMAENMKPKSAQEDVDNIPVPADSPPASLSPVVVKKKVQVIDDDDEPPVPTEVAQ